MHCYKDIGYSNTVTCWRVCAVMDEMVLLATQTVFIANGLTLYINCLNIVAILFTMCKSVISLYYVAIMVGIKQSINKYHQDYIFLVPISLFSQIDSGDMWHSLTICLWCAGLLECGEKLWARCVQSPVCSPSHCLCLSSSPTSIISTIERLTKKKCSLKTSIM